MNKKIIVLTAVLILQFILAGVMLFDSDDAGNNNPSKLLVEVDFKKLAGITITEGENTLSLTNTNNRWQLKNFPALKVIENKIELLTKTLPNKRISWPITTSSNSHQRFKVTTNNFEKKITFFNTEGSEQSLLFGSAPSFKQLYVRNLSSDDVYTIEFSAHQITSLVDDWVDKSLLSLARVNKISQSELNLEKNESVWQLPAPASLDEKQKLDQTAISDFVEQFSNLTVSGIAETPPNSTNKNSLTVQTDQNTSYLYSFAADDEDYFINRDDIAQWFKLSKSTYEKLTNVSLEQFISEHITDENIEQETSNKTLE